MLPTAPDWRRFLDLLQQRGGSGQAEAVFRRWVVTDDEAAILDTRDAARDAYTELVAVGDGWQPGWVVREPLGRWDFAKATAAIDEARDILTTRRRIEDAAAALGLELPDTLKTAYEQEKRDLATVQALADRQLATEASLAEAGRRAAAERPPLTAIGLLGLDPDAELATARAAFSAGDLDAVDADLGAMTDMLDSAVETGRERVAVAGLAGAGVLAAGGVAVYAVRRRRRRIAAPVAGPPPAMDPALPIAAEPPIAPDSPASEVAAVAPEASAGPDSYATLGDPRRTGAGPDDPAGVDNGGDGT
jgi:hypothetical protein